MSTAGYANREYGHTGQGFSYLWGALGANAILGVSLASAAAAAATSRARTARCDATWSTTSLTPVTMTAMSAAAGIASSSRAQACSVVVPERATSCQCTSTRQRRASSRASGAGRPGMLCASLAGDSCQRIAHFCGGLETVGWIDRHQTQDDHLRAFTQRRRHLARPRVDALLMGSNDLGQRAAGDRPDERAG